MISVTPTSAGVLPAFANAVDVALAPFEFGLHNRAKLGDDGLLRRSAILQLAAASSPHKTWLSAMKVDQKLTTPEELRDWQAASWNAWPPPWQYGT